MVRKKQGDSIMYKVRFHLGKGSNFKHWQVRTLETVQYHDPQDTFLLMRGCLLVNESKTAEKVHEDQVRDVCGWVLCESLEAHALPVEEKGDMLLYDPKIVPHWTNGADPQNIDGTRWDTLVTHGKKVFTIKS